MPSCSAIACTNRSTNCSFTFHQIPSQRKRPELRKRWLANIKRNGTLPKDSGFYICSQHFEESCFERDLKAELLYKKEGAKMLKDDAVPTLFAFSKPAPKRKSSIARSERIEKRKLLDEVLVEMSETIEEESTKHASTQTEETEVCLEKKRMVNKGTQYDEDDATLTTDFTDTKLKVKMAFKTTKRNRDSDVNKIDLNFNDEVTAEHIESDVDSTNEHNTSFHLSQAEESDETEESDERDIEIDTHCDASFMPDNQSIYLVFWTSLLELLNICFRCKAPAIITNVRQQGVMIEVSLRCINHHLSFWRSTPLINRMSKGNLTMSAALLYSGNTFSRIQEMMKICGVGFIGRTCYHEIQKKILFPVINHIYSTNRKKQLRHSNGEDGLDLVGDGRCDSPGFNAKYGTYTVMDVSTNAILDFSVVHVGTVANSSHMEKQGLLDCFDSLERENMTLKRLTTDRHVQIKAYMKKNRSDIRHQFDVWHVSKNIKKKLTKLASKKDCGSLRSWISSIINHFWWCCASCAGDPVLLTEKWLSLLYHIINRHTWEDTIKYKSCEHSRLSKRDQREKLWLIEGSPAYVALESVVKDKHLLGDLSYLTDFKHTGKIEVYHSLYNKFCPKRLHFSWNGMVARSQLAVMDYNCGVNCQQAMTKESQLRFKQSFSKVTQSWVVKSISEKKDKNYLLELMNETIKCKARNIFHELPRQPDNVPRCLSSKEKPNKEEAIQNKRTRFSM